jgi:WD40 repeat protein
MLLIVAVAARGDEPKDALGDPLPPGAKARLGSARGVTWGRRDITFLPPDYKTIATVDPQKGVTIADMQSNRVLKQLTSEKQRSMHLVAVSHDGKRVATWDYGVITVWEIATGRQVLTFKPGPETASTAVFGQFSVYSLSGDGKLLALGGWPVPPKKGPDSLGEEPEVAVTVWDVEKNERVSRVAIKQNAHLMPVLSQDGKTLATYGIQHYLSSPSKSKADDPTLAPPPRPSPDPTKMLHLWDVPTGKLISQVRMSQRSPMSIALSPDGLTVAVGFYDGLIERWDTRTGKAKLPLRTSDTGLLRVAFSPDSSILGAVAVRGLVTRWKNADGRVLDETRLPSGRVSALGLLDNATAIVWKGDNSQYSFAWEAPSGKLLSPHREHDSPIVGIGFLAGGKEIITSGGGTRLVRWNVATGRPVGSTMLEVKTPSTIVPGAYFPGVSLSPDASRAMSGVGLYPTSVPVVYDPATGAKSFALPPAPKGVATHALASADLNRVVRLFVDTDAKATKAECEVWDVGAREKIKDLTLPTVNDQGDRLILPPSFGGEQLAALSPDGFRLVTLGMEKTAKRVPGQPPRQPALLVTGWDLKTAKQLAVLQFPKELNANRTVAVATNRSAVFRANPGFPHVVDYERGHHVFELERAFHQPMGLAPVFSPDGNSFATAIATKEGTFGVCLYDWQRGKTLHTFVGHAAPISCLTFSPDGKTLASGSYDTTVLLWDLSAIRK